MKKFTLLLAAAAISFALESCFSDIDKDNKKDAPDITVSQTLYKEEQADMPEDLLSICDIGSLENSGFRMIYEDKSRIVKYADYDENMNITYGEELFSDEEIWQSCYDIKTDGSIEALVMTVESDSEKYSDEFYQNAEVYFEIFNISPNGEMTSVKVKGIDKYYSLSEDFIQNFAEVNGKYLISTSKFRLIIDETGNITESAESDPFIFSCTASDGRIVTADRQKFSISEKLSLDAPEKTSEYGKYLYLSQGIATGQEGFLVYFMLNDGVFGLTEKGSVVKIMDYAASLMSSSDYYKVVHVGSGKFAAIAQGDSGNYLSYMTVRPDGYVMNREPVVVAVASPLNDNDRELASRYNKQSDSYTVELKAYDQLDDLSGDILSGNAPDVYSFDDSLDMNKLVNLGAVSNMYELSEKYGGFKKEDILDNIISAYEYKGGLYMISQDFQVNLTLGNKNYFPKTKISYEELFDIADNIPDNTYFSNAIGVKSDEDIFEYTCTDSLGDWINIEKGECSFDSERFVELLNFTKRASHLSAIDWDELNKTASDEEIELLYKEEKSRLKNNTALILKDIFVFSLYEVSITDQYNIKLEDTMLLEPFGDTSEGYVYSNNYYSVIANGNCPQGGWDYINFLVSDKFLTNYLQTKDKFVTRKESFEKINERILYEQEYAKMHNSETYDIGNTHKMIANISDNEYEMIMEYISKCTSLKAVYNDIVDILNEEYMSFSSGEITAERCAELIQDRVSIYLSENL